MTVLLAAAVTSLGCPSLGAYLCADPADCDLAQEGACEPDGRCSYPDEGCPSGRRYATDEAQGGPCVEAPSSTESDADSSGGGARCGDGILDSGEDCDDGDALVGNGCNPDCQRSGQPIWTKSIDHVGGNDRGFGMAVSDDGSIAVVGLVTQTDGDEDAIVVLLDPAGEERWTRVVENPGPDAFEQPFFTDDGDLIVCGRMTVVPEGADPQPQGQLQGWIERIDPLGQSTWRVVLDEPTQSWIKDCRPFGDEDFVIAGTTEDPERGYGLFGRFGRDGTERWIRRHGEPALQQTQLTAAMEGPEGEVVIGGRIDLGEGWLSVISAYDADGQGLVWDTEPGADLGVEEQFSIARVGDTIYGMGRVFFQGGTYGWLGRFEDHAPAGSKIAAEVGIGNEFHRMVGTVGGDLLVAGSIRGHDIWILRYGPDFSDRWAVEVAGDGGGHDKAWDIAVAPEGNVIVAGYETTVTEDANLWVGSYTP